MKRFTNRPNGFTNLRRVSAIAALTMTMTALPVRADETTAEDRVVGGVVGGIAGGATGATAGWAFDQVTAAPISANAAAEIKDAAGRQSWNDNWYDWMSENEAAEHKQAIAEAKEELAQKQQQKIAAAATREARFQDRVSQVRKKNPARADKIERSHINRLEASQDAAHARRLQKQKELFPAIEKFAGDDRVGGRRKVAKTAKAGKIGSSVKGTIAGGAAGMVAGAALGVDVPDAVDAALFAGKLLSHPEHADELLAETAEDGVKMAGTVATTITHPAKMVGNLGHAVEGIGEDIKATGLFKARSLVQTRVDANGECHTDSILYRCQLQTARNQNSSSGSSLRRDVFKPISRASHDIGASVYNNAKSFNHAVSQADRNINHSINTVNREVFKPVDHTIDDFGRNFSHGGKSINRAAGQINRTINHSVNAVNRDIFKPIDRAFKQTTRNVGNDLKKLFGIRR